MKRALAELAQRCAGPVALVALAVALAGNATVFVVNDHSNHGLRGQANNLRAEVQARAATGRNNRILIASTVRQLCVQFDTAIYTLEAKAARQATVRYYRSFFPTMPAAQLQRLVDGARRQARQVEQRFDPGRCLTLPTARFLTDRPGKPSRHGSAGR